MKKLLALIPVVTLIGCIDLNQSINIKDDGTANYQMEMAIDAKIAAMAGKSDPMEMCGDFYQKKLPNELTATSKSFFSKGDVICQMSVTGPVDKFSEALIAAQKKNQKGEFLKVTNLGNDIYRIESIMITEPDNKVQDKQAQKMAAAFLAGRAMRWDIKAEEVIDSNGQISADKKSVHWELPMSVVMKEGEHRFWADIRISTSWITKIKNMFE